MSDDQRTTDDLKARLRKDVFYGEARLHNLSRHNPLHMEAADCIEQLERQIKSYADALEAERKTADHLVSALKLALTQSVAKNVEDREQAMREAYSAAYGAVHVMEEIARTGARIAFGVTEDPEICLGPITLPDGKTVYCSASFTHDEWSFYFEVGGAVFHGVLPNLEMPDGLVSAIAEHIAVSISAELKTDSRITDIRVIEEGWCDG